MSSIARPFADDDEQASHLPAVARAAAFAWPPPGFEAFDTGEAPPDTESPETAAADGDSDVATTPDPGASQPSGDAPPEAPANGSDASNGSGHATAPVNGEDPDAPATQVPEFLRVSP